MESPFVVSKRLDGHRTPTEVRMYPDRGTHVSRPRYARIPTEVRTHSNRNAATCQPKQPIIIYKKRHSSLQSCAFFLFYLKPVNQAIA